MLHTTIDINILTGIRTNGSLIKVIRSLLIILLSWAMYWGSDYVPFELLKLTLFLNWFLGIRIVLKQS